MKESGYNNQKFQTNSVLAGLASVEKDHGVKRTPQKGLSIRGSKCFSERRIETNTIMY